VKKRLFAGAAFAILVAAGAMAAQTGALAGLGLPAAAAKASPSAGTPADLATAPVERRSMATTADLSGTLGYEGARPVLAGGVGTVTRLPSPGAVIERGGVLYELDGRVRPRLLYGSRPIWRPLGPGIPDGADILQLEQNLVALGHAPKGLKVDAHWDAKTTAAVKRWQKATGRRQTGSLDGSDVVFLPDAVRVATLTAALGSQVGPGTPVLGTTTARRVVTLDLAASRQSLVKPGQAVTVELPGGTTVPGHVRSIGRVATAGENGAPATVPVTIDVDAGTNLPDLDAAPVTVHVVTEQRDGVLAVPVNALVALLEGGYAVEVVAQDGTHRYAGVKTGLYQDGKVEVSGQGLAPGNLVVVPR
jgi:hypothetical protein